MLKTRHFVKNKLAASVSLALAVSPFSAYAQNDESGMIEEEIVVTGIRGSLKRAQAVKMNSTSVVEALSAEDIGKLPDSSIAESLTRLPGLAGERRNGRTSGLSLRGFREDYVGTTLNGRELIGIGDNRGVDYDLYPSEIISGAVIHKSVEPTLSVTGVGGTIDLQTVRPLDASPTLTVNGSYERDDLDSGNPEYDSDGHRLAFIYSDNYADGTVGLSLTAATTESPNHEEFNSIWGYQEVARQDGSTVFAAQGIDIANRTRILERDTFAAVLQLAPTDSFTATFDLLHIDFEDSGITRGFIEGVGLPMNDNGTPDDSDDDFLNETGIEIENGFVTSATTAGFNSVIRSDPLNKEGELTTFGVNLEYAFNDNWQAAVDFSHSASEKVEQRGESYAGNGRSNSVAANQGAPTIRSYTVQSDGSLLFNTSNGANNIDFADYDNVTLAGPQGWGGGLASVDINTLQQGRPDVAGVGFQQAQDGFDNTKIFDESISSFEFEIKGDLEDSFFTSITAGVRSTSYEKSKENFGGFVTAPTFPDDGPIPVQYRSGTADLSWAGLGDIVAYDAQSVYDDNYYILTDGTLLEPDRQADSYTLEEEAFMQYTKADFESDNFFGSGLRVFGNIGYQALSVEQTVNNVNTVTDETFRVVASPQETTTDYFKFLPSLNFNIDFDDGHLLRLALAKTISKPRVDMLTQGTFVRFDYAQSTIEATDPASGPWRGAEGNPETQPFEVNQFDISYEWYFSDLGYVSVGYYYKDITNWAVRGTQTKDFAFAYIPELHRIADPDSPGDFIVPTIFEGNNQVTLDGLTGSAKGWEAQVNVPFGDFFEPLEGLGLVLSGSLTEGELTDDAGTEYRIPGLSEHVRQATLFYENSGFEVRVSGTSRSDYESETQGGSNSLNPIDRSGVTLIDAQISYDFADSGIASLEGLRVSLQGQNLDNEPEIFVDSGTGGVTRVSNYGARYALTFNYSIF